MKYNFIETVIGFIVIVIAIAFLAYLYAFSYQKQKDNSYVIEAKFQNVEGIIQGSDVIISGIKVGAVDKLTLHPDFFDVSVQLSIYQDIRIPTNSSAAIVSTGLFGNKYILITPGPATTFLKPHESIKRTHSAMNLESLIGKFMYSFNDKS